MLMIILIIIFLFRSNFNGPNIHSIKWPEVCVKRSHVNIISQSDCGNSANSLLNGAHSSERKIMSEALPLIENCPSPFEFNFLNKPFSQNLFVQ